MSRLRRGPARPSQDQHQRQDEGSERQTGGGGAAGAAQVEQASLEADLPGVLLQGLPDGADLLLAVGQRRQGARVEGFPVAVGKTKDGQKLDPRQLFMNSAAAVD